jgi:hypothetical protein
MKKLSPAQQRVLDLMAQGWTLKENGGYHMSVWLSRKKVEMILGLDTETVGVRTFFVLRDRRLIRSDTSYSSATNKWFLTNSANKTEEK